MSPGDIGKIHEKQAVRITVDAYPKPRPCTTRSTTSTARQGGLLLWTSW
ncbi:MAG: hypothetical protein ACLP9L_08940 [Thermoguttaceae bacterium]